MTRAGRIQAAFAGMTLMFAIGAAEAAAQTGTVSDNAAGAQISCGTFYHVQQGDSLHSIAVRAYGWGKYPPIYLANRDVLPDITAVHAGQLLLIPCLDGAISQPSSVSHTGTAAPTGTTPETPTATEPATVPENRAGASISCGTLYHVQKGDSLHSIAVRAYGWGKYPPIYLANRDILPDITAVHAGQQLLVPCLDGTGPSTRAEAESLAMLDVTETMPDAETAAPAQENLVHSVLADPAAATGPIATAAAVVADQPGIGLLSGPDFAPFADPDLPGGGMIAELVTLALAQSAPDRPARLNFVDDWSRHLSLLGTGEFDVGLPWYKPDCSRADRLSGTMRARCTGYIFSKPLFEVGMGFYVRAADQLRTAAAPAQLHGKRLCRPAGYFTFDLEQDGLFEPNLTRVIPPAAADCFTWLVRGEVDVVSLDTRTAAAEIARLGLAGRVADIPALAASQTLHVVASERSATGHSDIELINKGLADLQISGRWFEVVSRHLGAYGLSMR